MYSTRSHATIYFPVLLGDLTKTKIILLHSLQVHEEQLYEMFMYLRNTFGDSMKENVDKNNLADSILKLLADFVSITCFAFLQMYIKLYFFTRRGQLDIIERKACFVFGSTLSLYVCWSWCSLFNYVY